MIAGESVYPIEHVAWAFAEFPRSKHKAVPLQPHCAQARSVNTDTDFEASMHFSRNLVPDFTICASERFSYGAAGDATAAPWRYRRLASVCCLKAIDREQADASASVYGRSGHHAALRVFRPCAASIDEVA
jgi:hypothetical protein